MRQINATVFLSLDGVMQGPGGPEEDPTGGFEYGGWTVPYWDDVLAKAMSDAFADPFELLLGRRTYDVFAAHWPRVPTERTAEGFDAGQAEVARTFNAVTKHVVTRTPATLTWSNSRWIGPDVPLAVRELKRSQGPDLLVQGSSVLLQTLLAHDLVDELRLLVYPVALGKGKRLFGDGTKPSTFRVVGSTMSPSGVIVATYERAGDVRTGSFALAEPTTADSVAAD